jgi:hypothetical protein
VLRFSDSLYPRYDQKSVISVFKDFPNFTPCLGPGCGSGQIHADGHGQPIMTCTTCNFKTCFTHQVKWHSGMTCAEFDNPGVSGRERAKQEAASAKYIAKNAKICPNKKCGAVIVKNSGCDHMTCKSFLITEHYVIR